MATMIEVDNLGKKYRLGGQDKYYKTLRESLMRGFRRPFQQLVGKAPEEDEFWALRNVSFTVDEGEVVGIIGRNGAGKSTLLKLLSRITRPTEGCAKLYGRVGSLLEVGTGFHPELTGRENIYLSGNLLGMTRAEVRNKFDEIVDFSGVEKFLDTPVKHYSSGMYVRLGFAIAAHLEPEILLVDEVLAVGDAQFQKKCLGKMDEVAKSGRTVLFVSHNMAAVESLCGYVFVVGSGRIVFQGKATAATVFYRSESETTANADLAKRTRMGVCSLEAQVAHIEIFDANGRKPPNALHTDGSLTVHMTVNCSSSIRCGANLLLCDADRRPVACFHSAHTSGTMFDLTPGRRTLVCHISSPRLLEGRYFLDCGLAVPNSRVVDELPQALAFEAAPYHASGTGESIPRKWGVFYVPHEWALEEASGGG